MIGVKHQKDPCDSMHHGGWMIKIICWCFLVIFMFFLPNGIISFYVFVLSKIFAGTSHSLIASLVCYVATFAFNVNGIPASVLSLYRAYLCYSALASEPREYECYGLHHSKAVSTGTLTVGLLTTVLFVVYSAVRAGSSTTLLSPPSSLRAGAGKPLDKADQEEEKGKAKTVTYSYSFFHIIFSLARMYSAMLLTGWSTSVGENRKLVDVGWPSVWVRIVTGWMTAALFIWSQVGPVLFPERVF